MCRDGFTKNLLQIKPIHYMMLSLKTILRIRNGEELNMLPKGMELDYALEYYDNVGTKFHAAAVNAKIMVNRADLAVFTINTENVVTSKFIENGDLVVKAFNEKYPNGMFDYVHMMIGDIVFPTKVLYRSLYYFVYLSQCFILCIYYFLDNAYCGRYSMFLNATFVS